jgi:spermidine/putrescine transport system permease protein
MRAGGKRGWDGFAVYAVIYLSFIYLPVLFLPLFSFNDNIYVTFPLHGFTLEWYKKMLDDPGLLDALWNSVRVGLVVATASTVIGTLAAKAVTRYRLPGRGPLVGIIMVPLVIPEIIMGIALLVLLRQALDIELSLITVGLSHLLLCVPFSMLVMVSRLEGFDKSIEEAALDLGENPWGVFWRVTFPLAIPGIVASLLLTFTISFDEFVLAFFLSSTDQTLPLFIWSMLRFPQKLPTVLALGACILGASFVIITFSEWVRRRGVQPDSQSGV